jgi:hypothetical protein
MKICLIGNGYDLHHKFPTNYLDFLHVVHFLIEHKTETYATIGEILSSVELAEGNDFIKAVYKKHSDVYDKVRLDIETTKRIVELAENNVWFNYLYSAINKSLGWIDFEKEIIKVLNSFEDFFNNEKNIHYDGSNFVFDWSSFSCNKQTRFIVDNFNFFYCSIRANPIFPNSFMSISSDYIVEDPINSKCFYLDIEKITSTLFDSLTELAKLLSLYLKVFVDDPLVYMKEHGYSIKCASYPKADYVVNFNYTRTFEVLNDINTNVEHIHGTFDADVVLGINPDEKDELYSIDTTFLQFKKYYQRVFYRTDIKYLIKLQELNASKKYDTGHTLYVIGHSLDETDKDIIVELFGLANRIIVLYHDSRAVKSYIRNLVKIYGKEGFDEIRVNKRLDFLKQGELSWHKQPVEYN